MQTKKDKALYVVSAEVIGQKKSQLSNNTDGIGAYLNAFVSAVDALEAGIKVKEALEDDHYEVIKIEEIIESKNIEFNNDDETDFDKLQQEAVDTNEVVYGPIFVFEKYDK